MRKPAVVRSNFNFLSTLLLQGDEKTKGHLRFIHAIPEVMTKKVYKRLSSVKKIKHIKI